MYIFTSLFQVVAVTVLASIQAHQIRLRMNKWSGERKILDQPYSTKSWILCKMKKEAHCVTCSFLRGVPMKESKLFIWC